MVKLFFSTVISSALLTGCVHIDPGANLSPRAKVEYYTAELCAERGHFDGTKAHKDCMAGPARIEVIEALIVQAEAGIVASQPSSQPTIIYREQERSSSIMCNTVRTGSGSMTNCM